MGLTDELRIALQNEGINYVEDLANLRNPAHVPSQVDVNVFIRPWNFIIPARSLMRLKVAAE